MRILLVEDNPGDARLLREYLAEAGAGRYEVTQAERLSAGLEHLAEASFDAVLLDLSLPDSQGLAGLVRVHAASTDMPIVVLTGTEDEDLGVQLVQTGAQDYLLKGQMTAPLLVRSLRYAVERKQAEVKVRESEQRLRSLVESLQDVVLTLSKEGLITSLNPAFERLTHWSRDEWLRKPLASLLHADDLPFALDLVDHILAKGEPVRAALRFRTKEGGTFIGEFRGMPHMKDCQVVGVVGIVRDITESKRAEEALRVSEERFRAIMDNSPALMFLKDLEGRYLQINRRFEEVFHIANCDIIGKMDEEIFPPMQAAAFRADDQKVLDAGLAMEFEEKALHDDGFHTSIVMKFPLLNEQGQMSALCGIVTDITERRRAEKQLEETVDRVRTLSHRLNVVREEERTRIARELHDELGVRLTCLKLDLARLRSLMMRESLPPRDKMAEKIHSMTTEVDATIASVQRLAAELRPGILDDLGLVAAIEWQCQDFERRSGIRCLCEATQEIKLNPSCATAAFRICQEALTNVIRHAKATFVRVLVTQVNGDLLLEIQDDGQGISAEKLTDLASLGLLGMRERASSLGGHVGVASWPEKGTTVTLRLPCSEQADK